MTWFRLPLFVWSMYGAALVMVLATPVLAHDAGVDRPGATGRDWHL